MNEEFDKRLGRPLGFNLSVRKTELLPLRDVRKFKRYKGNWRALSKTRKALGELQKVYQGVALQPVVGVAQP